MNMSYTRYTNNFKFFAYHPLPQAIDVFKDVADRNLTRQCITSEPCLFSLASAMYKLSFIGRN